MLVVVGPRYCNHCVTRYMTSRICLHFTVLPKIIEIRFTITKLKLEGLCHFCFTSFKCFEFCSTRSNNCFGKKCVRWNNLCILYKKTLSNSSVEMSKYAMFLIMKRKRKFNIVLFTIYYNAVVKYDCHFLWKICANSMPIHCNLCKCKATIKKEI